MSERLRRGAAAVLATGLVACVVGVAWRWPSAAAAIGGVIAPLLALFAVRAWQHARVASELRRGSRPDRVAGIALRWRGLAARAAVAGLARPTVFCDPHVRAELETGELHAVVLHERHHQLRRDPLRLVMLAATGPLATAVPGGRAWLEHQRARIEIDADRFALAHGASRPQLASALLALGAPEPSTSLAGYACATDARLRWLVQGPQATLPPGRRRRWLVVGSLLGLVVVTCAVGWAHPTMTAAADAGACAWPGC